MVSDMHLSITLDRDLADRLEALAREDGRSLQDCLREAVVEFVAAREDFAQDMARLDNAEERVFLRVVGE